MDCSLTTWPSITQFDDFVWTGLVDINPLENLERTKKNDPEWNGPSYLNSQDTKPLSSFDTLLCSNNTQNTHTQSADFYSLSPSESLVAGRWESLNAVDLSSVLDSVFPREGVSSTPTTEDGYDLYRDDMLMQPEQQPGSEMDTFMDDPMSKVTDAFNTTTASDDVSTDASSVPHDSTSLPSSQDQLECQCDTVDCDTFGSINPPVYGEAPDNTHGSMLSGVNCKVQLMEVSEVLSSNSVECGDIMQPLGYYTLCPPKLAGSKDLCTSNQCELSDLKDPVVAAQKRQCIQSGITVQWPTSQLGMTRSPRHDGGKHTPQGSVQVGDEYHGATSPQVKLADAARLSSEMKRNRAQASRARRLAASQRRAEGRAKKYPLQKLIRMSSSSTCSRDRLGHNLAPVVPMLQSSVHMVSQTHLPRGGQSFPMNNVNPPIPTFLPVIFQGPQMASSHELCTHMNPVQVGPYYNFQHQQLVAHNEDNRLLSGSSASQLSPAQQAMQSLTLAPALHSSINSAKPLDVALLEQLQSVLSKMNGEMRLCIRDALYRLAKSANARQNRFENDSYSDSSSSHIEAVETQTNPIDRCIVDLLFCKQPSVPEAKPQCFAPIPSDAASQSMSDTANISGMSQQWNTCGSFLNLQDPPVHILTGS